MKHLDYDINKELKRGEDILWQGAPSNETNEIALLVYSIIGFLIFAIYFSNAAYIPFVGCLFIFLFVLYLSNREPSESKDKCYAITSDKVLIYKQRTPQKIFLKNIIDVQLNWNNIENNTQLDFWYLNRNLKRKKGSFHRLQNLHAVHNIFLDQLFLKGKNAVLIDHFKAFSQKNDFQFSNFSKEKQQCHISGIKDGVKFNIKINGLFPINNVLMDFDCPSSLDFAFKINSKKHGPPFNLSTNKISIEEVALEKLFEFQSSNETKFQKILDPKNQTGLLKHVKQFDQVQISYGDFSPEYKKEKKQKIRAIKDKEEVLDLHLIKRTGFIEEKGIVINKDKNTPLIFSGNFLDNAYKKPKYIALQLEASFKANLELVQGIIRNGNEGQQNI